VAIKGQADEARRRAQERKACPTSPADPTLDMTLRDLRRVLHEELRRLPDKYRLPLVLCYLEGRSHEEAAGQLGWSKGTFRGRLDRGREHLRRRLAARGVALSALLCAAAVAPRAVAESLVDSAVAGVLSTRASALAEGVIRAMTIGKLKFATVVFLAVGLIAGAAALARQAPAAGEQPVGSPKPEDLSPEPERAAAKLPAAEAKPAADDKETIAFGGRVLGPDGRPVSGAKLYMTLEMGYLHESSPWPERATTGADGRFAFTVPKAEFGDHWTVVAATAADHGAGWVQIPAGGKSDDLTLRLVADDVPVTGQIVDLEGKPIPGATVTVQQINAAPGEDLGPWLEAAKGKKGQSLKLEQQYLGRFTIALSRKVTTDAQGRFRLTGIGRNRLVHAQLDGPTVASQRLCILTRPGKPIEVTEHEGNAEEGEARVVATYYGADFRHVAAPCQVVVGVVRAGDTKKPLAGVTIRSLAQRINPSYFRTVYPIVRTTTDAEGRYRLTGLPRGKGYTIAVIPGSEQPYVVTSKDVPEGVGLDPVTVDIDLKRGVWIEGKMTDKVTGKPLQGSVEYFSLYSNPNLGDYPGFDGTILFNTVAAKADGSYRVVGLPGPGLIGVYYHRGSYLRAPDREDEYGTREESLEASPYHISFTSNFNALARVDPAKGVEKVVRDVKLDPGWSFTATVLGPDGKPLAGARTFDLNGRYWWERERMKSGEFTGWFNPRYPHDVLFQHPEKGLVGVAHPPKENGGTVTVRLEPGAAVTGRLVDADGRPRGGVELEVSFRLPEGRHWDDYCQRITTDREGRFRIEALLPGYEFRLSDGKGEWPLSGTLRSGQTKDLGDLKPKEPK
jgi:protocatechuate 3,4-dioxygenase beta subunit